MSLVAKRKTVVPEKGTAQEAVKTLGSKVTVTKNEVTTPESAIYWYFDGGGSEISDGINGYIPEFPFNCTITGWTLSADQSGSIAIDIWKDTYDNYPPTNDDTITGGQEPAISADDHARSTPATMTKWKLNISKGDCLGFNVDSCDTITFCTLKLQIRKAT